MDSFVYTVLLINVILLCTSVVSCHKFLYGRQIITNYIKLESAYDGTTSYKKKKKVLFSVKIKKCFLSLQKFIIYKFKFEKRII